jgi:MOB kinase activator 1
MPQMSLPEYRFEYLWEDGVKYKRPTKLSAPGYVDTLMNWVQGLLDDEAVFPNKLGTRCIAMNRGIATDRGNVGVPFPRNFRDIVKTITRRLFRIYAHLYSNHFEQICALGIEGKRLGYQYQTSVY